MRPIVGIGFLASLVFVLLCALLAYKPALAAVERYGYDPIGRLIQFIDSNNQVTQYTYDAAGNVISVTGGGDLSAVLPVFSTVAPNIIRRGDTQNIVITGLRLQGGTLQASHPSIEILGQQQTPTQITASLRVGVATPLGTQSISYTNAAGTATANITIAPALPALTVEPNPLALPPDSVSRSITLRLGSADAVAHTVNLSFSDTSKATISPASITFAAGQTSVLVSITPLAAGFGTLQLASPTLQPVAVPVFVTSDFRGVNTSNAAHVGVMVGDGAVVQPSAQALFTGPNVGVVVGAVLNAVTPAGMPVGSSQNLVVAGRGIPAGATVALSPADGVILGAPTVAQDGSSISLSLNIDPAAVAGPRRVDVRDSAGKLLPFANLASSQVEFTTGQPVLSSVDPLFVARGGIVELTVRGSNLQGAKVAVLPAIDLAIDSQPVVNAAGTELVVRVQVFPLAATGSRVVQITTPSGQSSAVASPFNQLSIVSEIQNDITPIISPVVGVVVGAGMGGETQTITPVAAPGVGVVTGAAAVSMSPKVGVIGTSVNFVINGVGLQAVQSVDLVSPEGLTASPFTVNAEGTALTLPVAIDAVAAKTLRKVVLRTATGRLPFVRESDATFLVAAESPEVFSATPQVLAAGANATLTLRGINFRDVQEVRFEPANGLSALQNITASADGTVLTVPVSVASNAATGPRIVVVVTAGGQSSNAATAANTVQVAQQVGPSYASIAAPLVGVRVGNAAQPPIATNASFIAPLVGVLVQGPAAPPVNVDGLFTAPNVGVLVGTAVSSISPASPDGFLIGSTGQLTINGVGLDVVTGISAQGTSGITFGEFSVNPARTQLTVPVNVAANVASGGYSLVINQTRDGVTSKVIAAPAGATGFSVGSLPTRIDSVSPIVLEQGKTYTFSVRGANLKDVFQLQAEPGAGLVFGTVQWTSDQFGENLLVPVTVGASATIGGRVVRLRVPGGLTSAIAEPANSIIVVAPQQQDD